MHIACGLRNMCSNYEAACPLEVSMYEQPCMFAAIIVCVALPASTFESSKFTIPRAKALFGSTTSVAGVSFLMPTVLLVQGLVDGEPLHTYSFAAMLHPTRNKKS
jgi:hypothetical protein